MALREIAGHLMIKGNGLGGVREALEAGNLAFKQEILDYVSYLWNNNVQTDPFRFQWPWRLPSQLTNTNLNIRHGFFTDNTQGYPGALSTGTLSSNDFARWREFMPTGDSYAASTEPFVIGAIGAANTAVESLSFVAWADNVMSITDVPTTQLGNPFVHPIFTGTATITSGSPWVTAMSFTGFSAAFPSNFFQSGYASNASVVRIEAGPDMGVYYVTDVDKTNTRLSLRTPDGNPFNPATTQTTLSISVGIRPSHFNETNVIPNGTGTVAFSGLFNPGAANNSYICKIHFEKSGSPTAGDSRQIGSYWFSLKPWTHGDGVLGTSTQQYFEDAGMIWDQRLPIVKTTNLLGQTGWFYNHQNFVGGCGGIEFDSTNQRMWFTTTDGTNGNVCYWLYKTPETAHEVASTGASPGDSGALSPALNLTGTVPRYIKIGSDQTVYVACVTTNTGINEPTQAGLAIIKTGLTTQTVRTTTEWALSTSSHFWGHSIDKTRFRTGTVGDSATTASANTVTDTSANFTNADVGRLIQLTGLSAGGDNGTYLISSVSSSSVVVVTTPTGGGVTFTGGTGGTFSIGDRIYLFFNDTTTVSNKVYYVESLMPQTLLSFTVSLTNGKKIAFGDRFGGGPVAAAVDPITGTLYWATQDTAYQINRFVPSTGTYNQILLSTFNGLNGGTGTATNPTIIQALGVNTNSAFRELWIGTDEGHVMIPTIDSQTWTSPTFNRYFGTMENPPYAKPANQFKTGGSSLTFNTTVGRAYQFQFGIDGRVWAMNGVVSGTGSYPEIVSYNRDSDNWTTSAGTANGDYTADTTHLAAFTIDPYGGGMLVQPYASANVGIVFNGAEIHYQWISSTWTPQEVMRGAAPDAISSPGLTAKPLHSSAAALVMGVQVAFTPLEGSTPSNNEFLGRLGQNIGYGGNDGAMDSATSISHTFNGSGFTTADVGNMLRIESGSQQGVYAITAFTNSTTITVRQYNNASFTGNGTSSLNYTVWSQNSQSNGGPEMCSIYWANGFGKDNTQDIDNIFYDFYSMKTILSEQVEAVKFCCPTLGVPGGTGVSTFFEYLAKTSANYEPGVPGMRATPVTGVQSGDGTQILDGMIDKQLSGTVGHADAYSSGSDGGWAGAPFSDSSVQGCSFVFDLGAPTQVGSIIVRAHSNSTDDVLNTDTAATSGMIALWLNELSTGTSPANATTVRFSGSSNLNLTYRNQTISLSSGDFTGSAVVGPRTTGSIITGQNTLVDSAATFTPPSSGNPGHLGMILQVTSSADAGYYRIIAVSSDGSTITIRNLNQSAYAWISTESGTLNYQVKNGVQEGDMVAVTTGGHTQHRLSIEYLATISSAFVRVTPNETFSGLSWNCIEPTWNTVTRIEYSVQGLPPEVVNNGTWMSEDGSESANGSTINADWKIYAGLTSLPAYLATGRYWKLSMMPRFTTGASDPSFYVDSVTFYDVSGNIIGLINYNMLDTVTSQPNFLASAVYRADFIQVTDYATTQIANTNGTAQLGGSTGNTVTLSSSGNKFLGFQVRAAGASGAAAGGNNIFNCAGSDPAFTASDVTRFIHIVSGPNAGYYRVASFTNSTTVTLTSPAGNAVSLSTDAGPTPFTVHEGINVGTTTPDYIAFAVTSFLSGGNFATIPEYSIATISDDLTTLTLNVPQYTTLSNQYFEIRRRANIDTSSTTTNPSISARAVYGSNTYPVQQGDIAQDSRGFFRFWAQDVGGGNPNTTGQTVISTDTFNGTNFTPDDVGRILLISSGADKGFYKVHAYTSATQVTLYNAYTNVAASFNANASTLSYSIFGERRFRMSRYTTVLRA